MLEFISKLFDTSDYPARWHCGNWTAFEGWLHIISDFGTWGAYMAIPFVIAYYALKKKELPYSNLYWLFCAFIFCCGTVHLVEAIIFWHPVYRVSGVIKFLTASVSWATVFALVRILPNALELPGLAQANVELRKTEQLLRTVLESAPNGLILINQWGTISLVNRETENLFGYDRKDLIGQPIEMLLPARFREGHQRFREEYFQNPLTRPMGAGRDLYGVRKDGGEFPVEIGLNPIETETGKMVLGSVVDITERIGALERERESARQQEALNEDLKKSNDELDNFCYIVSHDLKAPLRGISSLSSFVLEDAESVSQETRENLDLIRGRVRRMNNLIDGILEYSRVGRVETSIQDHESRALIEEVVEDLRPSSEAEIRLMSDFPSIRYDETAFQQIVQNLLSNALKHASKVGGIVEISAEDRGRSHVFSVKDNGPGISKNHHDRIFRIFQSLKPRDDEESTGVGLAIVKKLVERFDGEVWVESNEGEGAAFCFTIPKEPVGNHRG
ncbi:MAG: PAS domain S-box protein [Candidatus Omnitrophica bacterium]|nr:PAS domain S-box protein [Candidatus Omnitrophota bacterium]